MNHRFGWFKVGKQAFDILLLKAIQSSSDAFVRPQAHGMGVFVNISIWSHLFMSWYLMDVMVSVSSIYSYAAFVSINYTVTAIPYRESTGFLQGNPCVVFPPLHALVVYRVWRVKFYWNTGKYMHFCTGISTSYLHLLLCSCYRDFPALWKTTTWNFAKTGKTL